MKTPQNSSATEGCAPPAGSPVLWHLAATEPAPRGIYLLVADNYGRVFEGMRRRDGWEMLRIKGDSFEVWWWAELPDHPGIPAENVPSVPSADEKSPTKKQDV